MLALVNLLRQQKMAGYFLVRSCYCYLLNITLVELKLFSRQFKKQKTYSNTNFSKVTLTIWYFPILLNKMNAMPSPLFEIIPIPENSRIRWLVWTSHMRTQITIAGVKQMKTHYNIFEAIIILLLLLPSPSSVLSVC